MKGTVKSTGGPAVLMGGVVAAFVMLLVCTAPSMRAGTPSPGTAAELPAVVDDAVAFTSDEKVRLGELVGSLLAGHDVEAVVASRPATDPGSAEEADAAAAALMDELRIGAGHAGGLVVLFDLDATRCHGQARLFASAALRVLVPDADRQAIFEQAMLPPLRECRLVDAAAAGLTYVDRFLSGDRNLPGSDDAGAFLAVVLLLVVALSLMAALWVAARVAWGRVRALPAAREEYRARMARRRDGDPGAGANAPGFWAWWLGPARDHDDGLASRPWDGSGSAGVAERSETSRHAGGFGGGGAWTDAPSRPRGFGGGGFWTGLRDDAGRAVRFGGGSSGGSGADAGQGGGGSWSDAGSSGASSGGGGAGGAF